MQCASRLLKAEGRSARRQYGHIKAVAKYDDLESLKTAQLQILLTINSLDPKDYRLRDKVLEAVGDKGEKMNKRVFRRLMSEHERWLERSKGRQADNPRETQWREKRQHVGVAGKLHIEKISAPTGT